MEQSRRESYVDAFLPDYIGIFCVDLLSDKAEVLENRGLLGSAVRGTVPYSAGALRECMAMVAPAYRSWVEEQLLPDRLIWDLREQDAFQVSCQLTRDRLGRIDVRLHSRKNGEPEKVILALWNPERLKQLEHWTRFAGDDPVIRMKEWMKLEHGHHLEMIEGLTREYESVFLVNMNTFSYQTLRLNERLRDYIQGSLVPGYYKSLQKFCRDRVYLNDREPLLEALSPEGIRISLADNDDFSFIFRVIRESGPVYVRAKVVRVGRENSAPEEVLIGFANIQEERRAELQQRLLIESALQQAKQADAAKTMFLSNMSHDIRTPLNAILGYVALAELQPGRQEVVEDSLRKIRISGEHLLGLLDNVLDVSRIESGRMSLHETPCSLEAVVQNAVNMVLQEAESRKQELKVRIDPQLEDAVICDEVRLTQILSNLLGNSVKYTPAGGHISLEVRRGKRYADREEAVFKVRDDGIGMSEDFQKHIFEPFEREKNTTFSRIAGSGLGMSICRGLTDLMGGSIHVESSRSAGTSVEVRLEFRLEKKLRKENSGQTRDEKSLISRSRIFRESLHRVKKYTGVPKILLAEDNVMNREIASRMLRHLGYRVYTAENGEQALRTVFDTVSGNPDMAPDVILMDIQMPVMDGYTAAERIRAIQVPPGCEIPIIALTADAFESDIAHARRSGMNAFIAKPIDMEDLKELIETFMDRTDQSAQTADSADNVPDGGAQTAGSADMVPNGGAQTAGSRPEPGTPGKGDGLGTEK